MHPILQALFLLSYAVTVGVVLVVLSNKNGERRCVGEVLTEERDWGVLRFLGLGGLLLGMLLAWFARDVVPPAWSFPLLLAVAFVQVWRPDFGDRLCGTDGVRYGWYLRRLEDLEEWRLTGDHLRFRLFDIWRAVPLPAAEHDSMRARLEERAPGRESAFADRQTSSA